MKAFNNRFFCCVYNIDLKFSRKNLNPIHDNHRKGAADAKPDSDDDIVIVHENIR